MAFDPSGCDIACMAASLGVEDGALLTAEDAELVSLELILAKKHSYQLGLNLGLPQDVVEGIHMTHEKASDRLQAIVLEALGRGCSSSWRDIVDALRGPGLNLTSIANALEAAHLPNPFPTPLGEYEWGFKSGCQSAFFPPVAEPDTTTSASDVGQLTPAGKSAVYTVTHNNTFCSHCSA